MGLSANTRYLLKLTLVATLGGLLFGYDTAVISGTVSSLESFFVLPFGLDEMSANARLGFVVSSALIGCIIGGISGGIISKKLGRRNGLVLAALLFLVSAIGSAMPEMILKPIGEADHTFIYIFIIYRIIGGIGVGLASMLSPLYIAEIAPAKIKSIVPNENIVGFKVNNQFLDDCFILESNAVLFNMPNYILTLKSSENECFLQLYTPPHPNIIAIEPITGVSDSFSNGIGLKTLNPDDI